MMCFWLCKMENVRKIMCVFDLLDLEYIRIVLEELNTVDEMKKKYEEENA